LITALKGQAADVLYGIPTNATYEETLQAIEDHFRGQPFATSFHSQLKTRTQRAGKSLQDFSTAIEQRAHCAYPTLPEDHIRRDGVEDREIKVALLIRREKMVNEALKQALKPQAIFLATRSHKTSTKTFWGSRSTPTRQRNTRQSKYWSCGEPGHFESTCPYRRRAQNDHHRKLEYRPKRDTWESPRRSEWRPSDNEETNRKGCQPSGNEQGPSENGRCWHIH
jgi:hypothetical protein